MEASNATVVMLQQVRKLVKPEYFSPLDIFVIDTAYQALQKKKDNSITPHVMILSIYNSIARRHNLEPCPILSFYINDKKINMSLN